MNQNHLWVKARSLFVSQSLVLFRIYWLSEVGMIDLEKEREAFENITVNTLFDVIEYMPESDSYQPKEPILSFEVLQDACEINYGWMRWKTRARLAYEEAQNLQTEITALKQKLEKIESGEFVLVPRDKIEILWQDDDEPENFVNKESDFDCLGNCVDLNEIMTINAHHQANLKTEKLYGTWFAEYGNPKEKANFHVGTHQECLDIVAKNKTMLEASEKDHE